MPKTKSQSHNGLYYWHEREYQDTVLGTCFSKVPITFRAPKASCQTVIRLIWKVDLLTCFLKKKNKEYCEVWWLRTLALRRGELWHPKKARKVSGLLRNGPLVQMIQVTTHLGCAFPLGSLQGLQAMMSRKNRPLILADGWAGATMVLQINDVHCIY